MIYFGFHFWKPLPLKQIWPQFQFFYDIHWNVCDTKLYSVMNVGVLFIALPIHSHAHPINILYLICFVNSLFSFIYIFFYIYHLTRLSFAWCYLYFCLFFSWLINIGCLGYWIWRFFWTAYWFAFWCLRVLRWNENYEDLVNQFDWIICADWWAIYRFLNVVVCESFIADKRPVCTVSNCNALSL